MLRDREAESEAQEESERRGQQDLGGDPELQREQGPEPQDEPPAVELSFEEADQHERHQREEQDTRQMQVSLLLLAEDEAREAEQVPTDQGRPERAREMA